MTAPATGRTGKRLAADLLTLLLAGCGSVPPARWIRIDPPSDAPLAGALFPAPHAIVQVEPFAARGLLRQHPMAYLDRAAPTDLRQAATIVWEEAPGGAAATYMTDWLRRYGIEAAAPTIPLVPTYTLRGLVQRFELVGNGKTGVATVALDLSLVRARTGAPWFSGSYCAAVPAAGPQLRAVEIAFDAALARIAGDFTHDLAARARGRIIRRSNAHDSRLDPCRA
jgi:hypothetical protein